MKKGLTVFILVLGLTAPVLAKLNLTLAAEDGKTLKFGYFLPVVFGGIRGGFEKIQSELLRKIVREAAQKTCTPKALLYAISHREARRTWGYNDTEVNFFNSPDWWAGAPPQAICLGYGYDTCSATICSPAAPCRLGANVMGAMQFEKSTFEGYRAKIEALVKRAADRRVLTDAFLGAGFKIKANSGVGDCENWSEATVKSVARAYCGACDAPACGHNYCDEVYLRYLQYSGEEP